MNVPDETDLPKPDRCFFAFGAGARTCLGKSKHFMICLFPNGTELSVDIGLMEMSKVINTVQ